MQTLNYTGIILLVSVTLTRHTRSLYLKRLNLTEKIRVNSCLEVQEVYSEESQEMDPRGERIKVPPRTDDDDGWSWK